MISRSFACLKFQSLEAPYKKHIFSKKSISSPSSGLTAVTNF